MVKEVIKEPPILNLSAGRFLSVDPFIQSPENSQSFNPYSYVMNNPLSGVDPSGYVSNQVTDNTEANDTTGGTSKKYIAEVTEEEQEKIRKLCKRGCNVTEADGNLVIQASNGNSKQTTYYASSVPGSTSTNVSQDPSLGQQATSLGADVTPVLGSLKSLAQTITGKDLVTGEPLNRWIEAGGIVLGVLPGGKLLLKGGKVADVGEGAFDYFMKKADTLDVSTMRNSAVLYSGRGNRELAEAFATSNGKTTLEMTSGGKWLDDMKLFGSNSPLSPNQATQVWSRLSQRYAEGASGNAIGFVNGSRKGSIFNSVEYPALLKNKNVTNVITGGN